MCLMPFTFFLLPGVQEGHARRQPAIWCPGDHKLMLRMTEQKDKKILNPWWHSKASNPDLDHLPPGFPLLEKNETT